MRKSFRFIAISLIFTYVFMLYNIEKTQQVHASVLALGALETGFMTGAGESIAAAASVAAPYALPIIAGCVALGVVYKNRDQIRNFANGAANYLKSVGQGIGQGIIDLGDGVSTMTNQAKQALSDYVQKLKSNTINANYTVPLVQTVKVPANTTIWLNLSYPCTSYFNTKIQLLRTGNSGIDNVYPVYQVDGYSAIWYGYSGSNLQTLTYDSTGIHASNNPIVMPFYTSLRIGLQNRGTFDTDCGLIQVQDFDRSICANALPTYQVPEFSISAPTKVAPASTAMTWDDVIGLDSTHLKDKVIAQDASIPIDTPVPSNPPIDTTIPKDISLDFTPLQVATTKFPFCIPWDFVNVIRSFQGTPTAPKWVIDIPSLKGVKGTSITIDMSKFEKQAAIVRYFVLLSFIVFLILVTRNIIGG